MYMYMCMYLYLCVYVFVLCPIDNPTQKHMGETQMHCVCVCVCLCVCAHQPDQRQQPNV